MVSIIPCDRCDIGLLPHELDNGHCPECGSLLGEKTGLARTEQLREYKRQYYQDHVEEIREYQRQYYQDHIEELREKKRQYYQENIERWHEYNRQRYQENVEEKREYNRQYRLRKKKAD